MSHAHHHHNTADRGDRSLVAAVAVNVLLTAVQIVGGVMSGSLALVADALHNFSDAASLAFALVARRISRRPADIRRTFGYRRAEIIAAQINLTALVIVAIYLIYEAVVRFFDQRPIDGWIVVGMAAVALVVDVATALLTRAASKDSLNIRAAFFHNVADALASVAVIVAGSLILLFGWTWADLLATLLISAYILVQSVAMLKTAINILMQGVPEDLDVQQVADSIAGVEGVLGVHHLHIWQLDEHARSLEAHVVTDEADLAAREKLKLRIKAHLAARFSIDHSTLEFESTGPDGACLYPDGAHSCVHPRNAERPGVAR